MKWKAHVLIVDDVTDNIQVAMNILKEQDLDFSFALDGQRAIELADTTAFDLILLDIMMPQMNGFEVCKRLKAMDHTCDVPVIFLTARSDVDSISKGFENGGVDYITKPFHAEELLSRVGAHLELHFARRELKRQNLQLQQTSRIKEYRYITELEDNQKEIISMLMGLAEKASPQNDRRCKRVSDLSRFFAYYYPGLMDEDYNVIHHASLLLDIGNIGLPSEPFLKKAELTPEEREIVQSHTLNAGNILMNSSRKYINGARIIASQHHERWDGSGYPNQLKGEQIHVYARIVAVADVFEALTHDRPHRLAWPTEKAIDYICENKGTLFDPRVVEIFTNYIDDITAIAISS